MPELRRGGVEAALALLPEGRRVPQRGLRRLDPAVLPAVNMPTPGGLDMVELTALIMGAARRGRLVGGMPGGEAGRDGTRCGWDVGDGGGAGRADDDGGHVRVMLVGPVR